MSFASMGASCRLWGRISLNEQSGIVFDGSRNVLISKMTLGYPKGVLDLRYVHRMGEEDLRSQALVWTDYHRRHEPRSTRPSSVMHAIWYLHTRCTGFRVGHASIAASSALLTPWNRRFHGSTEPRSARRRPKGPEGKDCTGITTRSHHTPRRR
jgi:hypothetical protein